MKNRCACCGHIFHKGEMRCDSSIYGVGYVELCVNCSDIEEERIEMEGTNDIPWLLDTYVCGSIDEEG